MYIFPQAAASENGVIASALEKIPASIKAGIPTQPELQANFGNVYSVARQVSFLSFVRIYFELDRQYLDHRND